MSSKDKRRGQWGMTIDAVPEGPTTLVLAVSGRLGHASAAHLKQALEDGLAAGARRVAIDLEGVDYISSAALLVLDGINRRLHDAGGQFLLCALTEPALLVLELAGWRDRFVTVPSRADAIRRLAGARF
jgi:anti-sigma B factor antagonist